MDENPDGHCYAWSLSFAQRSIILATVVVLYLTEMWSDLRLPSTECFLPDQSLTLNGVINGHTFIYLCCEERCVLCGGRHSV